ncbi:MAG: phospholipid carrier-dependent glycosyltransferase [Patescibacteria group bacterium]
MKIAKRVFFYLKNWISKNKILSAILILSATLRFCGVYPGFPPTHPDETAIYGAASRMVRYFTYDPMRYDYGALPIILNAVVYAIFNPFFIIYSFIFAPENLPNFKNILDFYQQMVWSNQQIAIIYWGRFITSVFGVGTVYMVYKVAIKYFDDRTTALVAAFLTAVNYRQVLNSHMVLPDIYNAFFLLVAFYIFANLLKKPNKKNYILSGIIVGLNLSVKFSPFSIATFVFVHLVNTWRLMSGHSLKSFVKNKKILLKNLFKSDFIVGLLAIPIVFIIINPFLFLNWDSFYSSNHYSSLQYGMGSNNLSIFPISYLYHTGIGRIISIFILLGALLSFKKYAVYTLVFLSTIIPFFYVLVFYGYGGFYTRNFVTITPLLLIFAGIFLVETSLFIGKYLKIGKRFIIFLVIALSMIISWEQFKYSVLTTYYFSKSQNYVIANLWAQNNIPIGSTVATRTIDKFPKVKQFKIINFEYNDTYSLAEMQEKEVDYGYLATDELSMFFYWWMHQDTKQGLAYWDKKVPDSMSQNMYAAKVAEELASWSIASFIKPWQAPDVNHLIVKVPQKLELTNKKIIKEFSFDNIDDLSSWFLIDGYEDKTDRIFLDQSLGRANKGAVRFSPVSIFPNIGRAISPVIPLNNSSKAYEITSWIKTGNPLDEREKDGFLEVNFYENNPGKILLTTTSSYTALSSRVSGTTEWIRKVITVIAPQNAKFMTISFGVNEHKTPIWFDDLTVSESEDIFEDPRVASPYLNYYQIPQNILFPVSHGNF